MRAKTRVLFLSTNSFKSGALLDVGRFHLLQEFRHAAEETFYIQTNDFENTRPVEEAILKFKPSLVFSINAAGLSDSVLNYLEKNSIPIMTWFWDHPTYYHQEFVKNSLRTTIFHASCGFEKNHWLQGKGDFLPFSSIASNKPYQPKPKESYGLSFLGTCWHISRMSQIASLGLKNVDENKTYFGAELYQKFISSGDRLQRWENALGEEAPTHEILDAFASIRRAKILSYFSEFDLRIYGTHDWLFHLWSVAPELLSKVQYKTVFSQEAMEEHLSKHQINLNIFHLQNREGGPNLRILESATHGISILSDYNQTCEKIYPEGVAALYFKNASEAVEKANALLSDLELQRKLVTGAKEILNSAHTHTHRVAKFFEAANLPFKRNTEAGSLEVISNRLDPKIFQPGAKHYEESSPVENPQSSIYYKNELFHLSLKKNAVYWEIIARRYQEQEKIPLARFILQCTLTILRRIKNGLTRKFVSLR